MKKFLNISMLAVFVSLAIYGCKKDRGKSDSNIVPEKKEEVTTKIAEWKSTITSTSDVSVLLSELEMPLNTRMETVGATGNLQISFPDKLTVNINLPLRKKDGSVVTGIVEVKEILLRDKGDFIRQNRPTLTASAMLVTGGSYFLSITQGGEELTANYSFSLPQPDGNYDLFEGKDAGNNENVWDQVKDSGRIQRWRDSTSGTDTFYNFCCTDKFNWINCDFFYSCGCPLTAVKVKLPEEFGNLNTRVMCLFKDINSVTSLSGNPTSKLFETAGSYKAPVGEKVTIVVMCRKDGKYFFATKDVTLTLDGTYEITPGEVTLSAMKSLIDNL